MTITDLALYVSLPLLGVAILFTVGRLFYGPRMPDRVISLDQLGILGIGVIAIYAIGTNQLALLDVVLVIALISFLGTVAFAYYLQRRGIKQDGASRDH